MTQVRNDPGPKRPTYQGRNDHLQNWLKRPGRNDPGPKRPGTLLILSYCIEVKYNKFWYNTRPKNFRTPAPSSPFPLSPSPAPFTPVPLYPLIPVSPRHPPPHPRPPSLKWLTQYLGQYSHGLMDTMYGPIDNTRTT